MGQKVNPIGLRLGARWRAMRRGGSGEAGERQACGQASGCLTRRDRLFDAAHPRLRPFRRDDPVDVLALVRRRQGREGRRRLGVVVKLDLAGRGGRGSPAAERCRLRRSPGPPSLVRQAARSSAPWPATLSRMSWTVAFAREAVWPGDAADAPPCPRPAQRDRGAHADDDQAGAEEQGPHVVVTRPDVRAHVT